VTDYPAEPLRRSNCGTNAGHEQHVRWGERSCEPCRIAHRSYINAYYIRTGRNDQRKIPVEIIGALYASSTDETARERLVEFLGTDAVEACVGRAGINDIDEVAVERAIARALRKVEPAGELVGRQLTAAEQRVVARKLVERGHGTNAISKACRVTGTAAKQLHLEVTAA
jgi:hypothetical protein